MRLKIRKNTAECGASRDALAKLFFCDGHLALCRISLQYVTTPAGAKNKHIYMDENNYPLRKTARIAGLWYLLFGLTGAYGLIYVPGKIHVPGDFIATANNILANEFLFRTGIVSLLVNGITFIIGVLVLYRLLMRVNEQQAKLMAAFVIVQTPIIFILETLRITALMILKGQVIGTLELERQQDLVMTLIKAHDYGILLLELFMGLWLLPLGQLVYKSGFIPRIIGVLLIIAGIGYIIDSLAFTLFPYCSRFTQPVAFTFSGIGEFSIVLLLLIKGVKSHVPGSYKADK